MSLPSIHEPEPSDKVKLRAAADTLDRIGRTLDAKAEEQLASAASDLRTIAAIIEAYERKPVQ